METDPKTVLQMIAGERRRVAARLRECIVEVEKMAAQVEQGSPLPAEVPTDRPEIARALLLRDLADAHERAGVIGGYLTQALAPTARTVAHDALFAAVRDALPAKVTA